MSNRSAPSAGNVSYTPPVKIFGMLSQCILLNEPKHVQLETT